MDVTVRENLVARTPEELDYAFRVLSQATHLGCDTETGGFSARISRLLSMQLSDGKFSVLVPVSEGVGLGPLADLLASAEHLKIFHNAKFDLAFLLRTGCEVRNVFDSMIAEKLITKGADQSSSLAETLYRYFAVDLDKTSRKVFANRRWDGRWIPELVEYALSDVVYLPALHQKQAPWLNQLGLSGDFERRMMRLMQEASIGLGGRV